MVVFCSVFWILSLSLLCTLCQASDSVDISPKPSVTISKDEFCSGCLFTVQAYAEVSADTLTNMQNEKLPAGDVLNGMMYSIILHESYIIL